jgi:hypothetical protein
MAAEPGTRPPNAGKGRQKGSVNKVTKALKDMILGALDEAGGQTYLAKQAAANPAAFMTLVGKVLPLQVQGDKDAPLQVRVVASDHDERL